MQVRAFCLIQWQQFLTTCPEVASGVPYSSCSLVFAAMSTVLGVCENILAMIRELTGWSRPKGSVVCGTGVFLLHLPQPLVSAFSTSSHLPKELPGLISGILLFPTIFYHLALSSLHSSAVISSAGDGITLSKRAIPVRA